MGDSGQRTDANLAVPDLRFAPAVDLQRDASTLRDRRIRFGVVDCLRAVDEGDDAAALAADLVVVPLAAAERALAASA